MKKILSLSFILVLVASSSFAQRSIADGGRQRSLPGYQSRISRPEKFELRKDVFRVNRSQRMARRDGVVTPYEKRRIHKAKCNTRRDAFRFKHNGRR